MSNPNSIPNQDGYGDIFAYFAVFLGIALAIQAYTEVFRYADLRANGVEIEGRVVDSYTEPQSSTPMIIYSIEVDGQTHRNRQVRPNTLADDIETDDAIAIIYSPDNPELSRLVGTADYSPLMLIQFVLSIIVVVVAGQYLIAERFQFTAWILVILDRARKILRRRA